jgi:uncharacterized protein with GYD domain
MATYVVLFNWTDQGIKSFKDSPSRVDAANEAWADLGVRVESIYWTIGAYDLVGIMEAPDDAALTSALLRLAAVGNVRSTSMRALSRSEAEQAISRATG